MTARFLRTGRLREDGDPHPIPQRENDPAKEPDCGKSARDANAASGSGRQD
jgi:hypothetical protein